MQAHDNLVFPCGKAGMKGLRNKCRPKSCHLRGCWWCWTISPVTKRPNSFCGFRQRDHDALNAVGSFLVEHDRVDAANPCPAGIGGALPEEARGNHRMVGSGVARMELRVNAF